MPVNHAPGIRVCRTCDFIFALDIQSEDSNLYDSHFGDTNVRATYEKRDGKYVVRNRVKLEALLDRLEPYRQTGRFLDLGCSAAFFLSVAKERGWSPQGAEIAKWAADFSQRELGINVFNGMLQDAKFPDNHFDVVFSSHVMEHIGQPLDLLTEMARVLRPGGVHVTVVPTQFASPSWLLAKRFIGDPPPIHASFYTRDTYAAFLKKAGLRVKTRGNNRTQSPAPPHLLRGGKHLPVEAGITDVGRGAASHTVRPACVELAKNVFNVAGNPLDMGDEITAFAENPA
jgi:SAM-dependent methyltransferase